MTDGNAVWVVETSRWISSLEHQAFDSRDTAVAAVEAELAEMFGGWSTCPDLHADGCKWRKVPALEWANLGFDETATDRWMHSTRRTDIWHRERIYVRPIQEDE